MNNYLFRAYLMFSISLFGQSNTFITNIDNLKNAINSASAGDTITVKNGSYDSEGSITITNNGMEGKPIVVRAETVGNVELRGETYFDFRQCEHIILEGFNFTSQNVTAIKLQACNNIRITRNRFAIQESESVKWILVGGLWNDANALSHHNRIDHNLFENKSFPGNFITIDGTPDPTYISSQHDRIDHNHFRMNTPRAENEKESIRVGWSELSETSGFTIIEHNLFEDCDGDPEIISVKTCDDTVRYNTFIRCAGTLSLRHGNRTSVYGNFFLGENKSGTGGIRIYGDDHLIYNNYFEGLEGTTWDAPITLTNGDYDGGSNLSNHFRINRAIITNNTLIDNKHNIEIGFTNNGKYTKPPRDLTIANNIVVARENEIIKILTDPINTAWQNNLFYTTQTAVLGYNLDTNTYWNEDPFLEKDLFFKQTSVSPTIDKDSAQFVFLIDDIEGQIRRGLMDIGADEYSTDDILYKPLTPEDVGPGSELATSIESDSSNFVKIPFSLNRNYPNPFNSETNITVKIFEEDNYQLKIFNINGELVKIVFDGKLNKGINDFNISFNDLSSGSYYLRFSNNLVSKTQKIIYLK
ncbi:MAG: T9SS type A sorting domain-containing protein [Melioribacteraceae bacterium]|nr:T9SS type A sorting domain-containing protein [Melioribacteraceae bacterium]